MNIKIVAKTELGNTFKITANKNGITMKRDKDARGAAVKHDIFHGNKLHFVDGRFILRDGKRVVSETFGKAKITEVVIS